MCCRFLMEEVPELQPVLEAANRSPLTEKWAGSARIVTRGEARPADVVPVLAPDRRGKKAAFPMKWGFAYPDGRSGLLINARVETAAVRPAFRESWASRRYVIPAACYYEWEHITDAGGRKRTGGRYSIRPRGAAVTWLCGLYRIRNGLPEFVILTREPGEGIRFLHDRMPLILPDGYADEWIRPDRNPGELLPAALTDMTYEKTPRAARMNQTGIFI